MFAGQRPADSKGKQLRQAKCALAGAAFGNDGRYETSAKDIAKKPCARRDRRQITPGVPLTEIGRLVLLVFSRT